MTEVRLPSGKVPKLVQDLGLVSGLLEQRDDDLFFELSWFQSAIAQIKAIPSRRAELMTLLRDLLGDVDPTAPTDRAWYALPYPGAPSAAYIVLPPPETDSGSSTETIGVGIFKDFTHESLRVQAYLYVPLFEIPIANPIIVTGSANHPIVLMLTITGQTFIAGSVTFDGLRFEGDVFLKTAAPNFVPNFTLTFVNMNPDGPQSTVNTLDVLRSASVRDWVNAVLGNAGVAAWLDQHVGSSPYKIGGVLKAIGILESGEPYTLGSLDALVGKLPMKIAELLIAKALETLVANTKPLVKFGDHGGIWVYGNAGEAVTNYGLRLCVPDVSLKTKGSTAYVVQLGKHLSIDSDDNTWMSRSDPSGTFAPPGVSLTLVCVDAQNVPAFKPKVDIVSVGVDVTGSSGNPLVAVKGVTLAGMEPRFLVALDFDDLSHVPWGVAIHCDRLGLPLGNGLAGSSAKNPVAQNLLSSGGTSGGDKEPVNPAFSASIARVFGRPNSTINVILEAADGGLARTVWLPMQRAFGPLQCSRFGVQWPDGNEDLKLTFLFDGAVHLAALEVDLIGLSLGIPLRTPGQISNYSFDLQGLAISYVSGPLTISGGFSKNTSHEIIEYDGEAVIQAATWSIAAMGSYASLGGQPSLFIFARVGATIGGPPFFFVTGICAGFGYNRSIRFPTADDVPSFPLLAGIANPTAIGGASPSPGEALTKMGDWIQPAQGMNWFAAGVQFTSFELVNSNAVLVVLPTGDFQAALLGVSRIKLAQSGPQFAYAELGINVVIHPSAGFFGASAILSPNSYVINENCHLTGGFAFFVWFAGEHEGDFVVTLGGYHPAFQKPDWYPDVPRLGFSWQVNGNLTIQGGSYFALTPSCAMGGGSLNVDFHTGNLRAWLTAHADFLFHWNPFYYTGSVGVSVGASYELDLLFTSVTLSVELGADLELWGPPTGGRVHVDWYVISFTISFGADPRDADAIVGWSDFKALLPKNDAQQPRPMAMALDASADDDVPLTNVVSFSSNVQSMDGDRWLVRAGSLVFHVDTKFPVTEVNLTNASGAATKSTPDDSSYFVAVRPMGISSTTSAMALTMTGSGGTQNLGSGWSWTQSLRNVPAAMWDKPLGGAPPPSSKTIPNRLVGVVDVTPIIPQPSGPGPIPLTNLEHAPINLKDSNYLALSGTEATVARQPQKVPTSLATIKTTIVSNGTRADLLTALKAFGYDPGANDSMSVFAQRIDLSYPTAPMLGAPWQGAQ
jgi:hypothetical protein